MHNLRERYLENGYCIVKDLNSIISPKIDKIFQELTEIGKTFEKNFDLTSPKSIANANKDKFYRAIKYPIGIFNLAATKELVEIVKKLNCQTPTLNGAWVRADISTEKNHATGWHQDGPNVMGSFKNGVCTWFPLFEVNKDIGSMEVIKKSHLKGVYKFKIKKDGGLNVDDDSVPVEGREIINIKKGEFVIFHPLLIHRSHYPTLSNKTRVTAMIRFDDMSDKKHRKNGYITSFDGKNIITAPQYKDF